MKKGNTLLELLLYSALFSILSITLVVSYINLRLSANKNQAILKVSNVARDNLSLISNSISNSISVISPNSGLMSNSLTLQSSNSLKNPTQFYISSNVLYIKEGENSPNALTPSDISVDSITFTNVSNVNTSQVSVSINLSLSYKSLIPGRQFSNTFYATETLH